MPKAFVKMSTGLRLNTLRQNEWEPSLEKPVLSIRVTEVHLPCTAIGAPAS